MTPVDPHTAVLLRIVLKLAVLVVFLAWLATHPA